MSHFLFQVGKAKASVVDEMKWNQPLLRGMPRLADNIGRGANNGDVVKDGFANVGQWKATGRRHGTALLQFDIGF